MTETFTFSVHHCSLHARETSEFIGASKNTRQNKTEQTPTRPLAEGKTARNCGVRSDALARGDELRDRKRPAQTLDRGDGFCNRYKKIT